MKQARLLICRLIVILLGITLVLTLTGVQAQPTVSLRLAAGTAVSGGVSADGSFVVIWSLAPFGGTPAASDQYEVVSGLVPAVPPDAQLHLPLLRR